MISDPPASRSPVHTKHQSQAYLSNFEKDTRLERLPIDENGSRISLRSRDICMPAAIESSKSGRKPDLKMGFGIQVSKGESDFNKPSRQPALVRCHFEKNQPTPMPVINRTHAKQGSIFVLPPGKPLAPPPPLCRQKLPKPSYKLSYDLSAKRTKPAHVAHLPVLKHPRSSLRPFDYNRASISHMVEAISEKSLSSEDKLLTDAVSGLALMASTT